MKHLGIWFLISALLFGAYGGAAHWMLSKHPKKVLAAVDTSFSMKSDAQQAFAVLDRLDDRRYSVFALITEKTKIHTWAEKFSPTGFAAYAPRDFSKLSDSGIFSEIAEADERFLITNAPDDELQGARGWKIMRPR